MRIYILEAKGEVLNVLTHRENKSYMEFKKEVEEAGEDCNNDFYTVKDVLISLYGYEVVEVAGSAEVAKKKGIF